MTWLAARFDALGVARRGLADLARRALGGRAGEDRGREQVR